MDNPRKIFNRKLSEALEARNLRPIDIQRQNYTPEIKAAMEEAINYTCLYSFTDCANWLGMTQVKLWNKLYKNKIVPAWV